MRTDRRGFLGLFGVGAAIVAADGEVTEEVAKPEPIPTLSPQEHQTMRIRNTLERFMDVQSGRLYSSLVVAGKDYVFYEGPEHGEGSLKSRHHFFHYGLGSSNPYVTPWCRTDGITFAETNMGQASRLDAPEAFIVERCGLLLSPSNDRDLQARLIDDYCFEIWLGSKEYFRRPLAEVFQVRDFEPTKPILGLVEIKMPLIIAHQMCFNAQIAGTPFNWAGDQRLKMWAVFDGHTLAAFSSPGNDQKIPTARCGRVAKAL
jgi:hypothetical protein